MAQSNTTIIGTPFDTNNNGIDRRIVILSCSQLYPMFSDKKEITFTTLCLKTANSVIVLCPLQK